MTKQWIMGKNCVREVLRHAPKRLIKVYTSSKQDALIDELHQEQIPIQRQTSHELTHLVETESHQGFVAQVKERPLLSLKELIHQLDQKEHSLLLLLDSIFDPHNMGAILRAAECFNVDAVIWSKNRGCDITPVVTKASVGASELVPLVKVSNLADAIRQLKAAHFSAVTAEIEGATPLTQLSLPSKTALILGSEGEGVRSLISKLADVKVAIPLHGHIESLNVSQAAAVLLSYLTS